MAKVRHTLFGKWYFSQPKVVRERIMQQFKQKKISEFTVRNWMTKELVPAKENRKAVESITNTTIVELFPY